MTNLDQKLSQIIEDLKPYQPEKVILFGSCLQDSQRESSDIDLFIIKQTSKTKAQRIGEVLDHLYKKENFGRGRYTIPIDPLVYTPDEVQNRLSLGDPFVTQVINLGKTIYESR